MWRVAAVCLSLLALVLPACGGSDRSEAPEPTGPFVGATALEGLFVAIVPGKENVAAYVCDGRGTAVAFSGRPKDGSASLTAEDGSKLSVSLAEERAMGSVTLASGETTSFVADPATGDAGLYIVPRGEPVKTSWVVLNDGRQKGGLRGARVNPARSIGTVPDVGQVEVVRVTSREVSDAGFGGGGSFQLGGG